MAGKFSIYKYCKTGADWRYRKAAFYPNGKIKPNVVLVKGKGRKAHRRQPQAAQPPQSMDCGWQDALDAQRGRR